MTALLTLRDLADGGADLSLAPSGQPVDVLALVSLDDLGADAALLARAAAAAARSSRILVGLAEGPVPTGAGPVLDALACSLVVGRPAEVLPQTCVRVAALDAAVDVLERSVTAAPVAAAMLPDLLRLTSLRSVEEGLLAESLTYSVLLAGPEFARWRAGRPRRPPSEPGPSPVLLGRADDTLTITLNRPGRHNAYSSSVRDGLVEGLELAAADRSLTRVVLRGAGPSFSSGGDLDEFGTAPDVATAHLVRRTRSAGALLHRCADRIRAEVHGSCIGAGVELAAFAGTVVAAPDTTFQLPELRMGLVPGAGGTVSLPRRIGRWRTAHLALTGASVDVETALAWGLVDARA